MRLSKPRIQPLTESGSDPAAREVLERLRTPDGKRVLNIFATLAHHPDLLRRWLVFGNHVLGKSTLTPRQRELLILRTGWLWRAEYEWAQHAVIARMSDIRDDEIQRVTEGPDAPGWTELESALLRAVDELRADAFVTDATWSVLARHLTTMQLMDLVFTVGQYTLVSMALNSFGVPLDPGLEGFPEESPAPASR
jgi:4-carboxymuconolactone decarboxylase